MKNASLGIGVSRCHALNGVVGGVYMAVGSRGNVCKRV